MKRVTKFLQIAAILMLSFALAMSLIGCSAPATSSQASTDEGNTANQTTTIEDSATPMGSAQEYPIVIEHAFGETVIEEKPERVATVNWANHEVPLALGVMPVGMAVANFGDDDSDGMLPWVEEKVAELGGEAPVLFDETDGIDFEAVADTQPDVILAAYSGLTQETYDTLSEIAPVVAFPETAWGTSWRDTIIYNSMGMGMAAEGEELVANLEQKMEDAAANYPSLEGKTVMFLTHVDTTDLSEVSFYTTHDTRVMFFEDLGLTHAPSIAKASAETDKFSLTISAEQSDTLNDVDIIVTYGAEELMTALQGDPVLSQIPAVKNGAVVYLSGDGPMGTAANPTPLSIEWVLDDYLKLLEEAAAKSA